MAVETKYNRDHHAGPDAASRIANRLKNSGSPEADTVVQTGNSARRTFHNIHNAGNAGRRDNGGKSVGPLTAGNKDRDLYELGMTRILLRSASMGVDWLTEIAAPVHVVPPCLVTTPVKLQGPCILLGDEMSDRAKELLGVAALGVAREKFTMTDEERELMTSLTAEECWEIARRCREKARLWTKQAKVYEMHARHRNGKH
jgi:hypothetical protein